MVLFPATNAQHLIRTLLAAGATLSDIEREIAKIGSLDEEDRAALWLLAWSHLESRPGAEQLIPDAGVTAHVPAP